MALVVVLVTVVGASAAFAAGARGDPAWARPFLFLFLGLFAIRVGGQLFALATEPAWLPPPASWNLLPYRLLLPVQLVLLGLMSAIGAGLSRSPGDRAGHVLVALAVAYWIAMVVRYAARMTRRPGERWFGGAIPIVFHCVLAAWLFVLGSFLAAG